MELENLVKSLRENMLFQPLPLDVEQEVKVA